MIKCVQSRENVYADLNREDADEMLVKAQLASKIGEIIKSRKWIPQTRFYVFGQMNAP